jgi:hypothetical protein
LGEPSIIAPYIGITACTVELILQSNVSIEHVCAIHIIETAEGPSHGLGSTLYLWAEEHFYLLVLYKLKL